MTEGHGDEFAGSVKSRLEEGAGFGEAFKGGFSDAKKGLEKKLDPKNIKKEFIKGAFGGDDIFSAYMRGKFRDKSKDKKVGDENSPSQAGSAESGSFTELNSFLKIIAKNALSLHLMARDMNVLRQNIVKLVKMEARAASQEDLAPWMALTEAGFKTMQGTSPYALANIGAGAEVGLKSYGGAQDKIAALEEKRYALMNDAAKADRAEKQAAITFGENSYQHKATMEQRDRLANAVNKLKSEEIGVQRARVDAISGKSNIKGMVDQILKANKEIDADLSIYNKIKKPSPEQINYIKKLIQDKAANEAKIKSYYNQNKGGLANVELSESDPLGLLN
jgi:hypothetical protein